MERLFCCCAGPWHNARHVSAPAPLTCVVSRLCCTWAPCNECCDACPTPAPCSYFGIEDIETANVRGLQGLEYLDRVRGLSIRFSSSIALPLRVSQAGGR